MIKLGELWLAIEARVVELIHRTEARGCRVTSKATQSINDSTWTALSFDTEICDTDECWAVGDPTYLYAQRDGYYLAGGSWGLTSTSNTAACKMGIRISAGSVYVLESEIFTLANKAVYITAASGMFWLAAGEAVRVFAYHEEGGAKSAAASSDTIHLTSAWLMRVG
jgi:hypothetical protein